MHARHWLRKALTITLAACAVALLSTHTLAQRSDRPLQRNLRTNGERVVSAFADVVGETHASVVRVMGDGKAVALGAIVAPDGFIVTKASELNSDSLAVALADGRGFRAHVANVDKDNDLALLKVAAEGLPAVTWGDSNALAQGAWVVAVWPDDHRVQVGVVSAQRRRIARTGGVLGIGLGEDRRGVDGVVVARVFPDSGAAEAGVEVGDIVLSVNGEITAQRTALIDKVTQHDPGEIVKLRIRRGDATFDKDVMLGHRSQVFDLFNRNQRMSGPTSKRRSGFVAVIQHDIPLGPDTMGSPIVDLSGKVVGINIARVNRSETYALPADVVEPSVRKLIAAARKAESAAAE